MDIKNAPFYIKVVAGLSDTPIVDLPGWNSKETISPIIWNIVRSFDFFYSFEIPENFGCIFSDFPLYSKKKEESA
jgi:hypothetical protein